MSEDDLDEIFESDLFDISDIELDFQRTKGNRKLYVILKSDSSINLMRYYLKMKEHLFQLEAEIGIMPEDGLEEH